MVAQSFLTALQNDERANYQLDVKFQEFDMNKIVSLLQCQLSEGVVSEKYTKAEDLESGVAQNGTDADEIEEGELPDSHGWCRCENQQSDRTKGRISVLCCPGLGRRHWCEGCKDHRLGFPGIQSLCHHGIALVRTAGAHRNLNHYCGLKEREIAFEKQEREMHESR